MTIDEKITDIVNRIERFDKMPYTKECIDSADNFEDVENLEDEEYSFLMFTVFRLLKYNNVVRKIVVNRKKIGLGILDKIKQEQFPSARLFAIDDKNTPSILNNEAFKKYTSQGNV